MALDLPSQTECFVDTTIFYGAMVDDPAHTRQCRDFVDRIVAQDVWAFVSAGVIADVVHKVMCAEAVSKFGWPRAGIIGRFNKHPERIDELSGHVAAMRSLARLPCPYLPVNAMTLIEAAEITRQSGLLMNDACIVALMRRHGITHLVTNDDDFDAVAGLMIWKPR